MSDRARILAEVFDYAGLIMALRARAVERRISLSSDQNHALAGLPDRYMARLLAPGFKINRRHLGHRSMGPVLSLLGVKLMVVVDEEAIAKYGHRLERMDERQMRCKARALHFEVSLHELRRRASIGGVNRWKGVSQTERQRCARIAARARWKKESAK